MVHKPYIDSVVAVCVALLYGLEVISVLTVYGSSNAQLEYRRSFFPVYIMGDCPPHLMQ